MVDPVFEKVTLVGPGLIGGSLGMALRARGLAGEVIGVGHRQVSIDAAVELGAIDRGTLDLAEGADGADLIVLCTGVKLIQQQAAEVIPLMKAGAVLTDVGSSKEEITTTIESLLADRDDVAYLGTHPLAGMEKRGVQAAVETLYEGSLCIFCPTAHTTPESADALRRLWEGVGAAIREIDPATHDHMLSQISHLPHLVASALTSAVSEDALALAASGFRDTTRIAAGDPDLWTAIFLSNRKNLIAGLHSLLGRLNAFSDALADEDRHTLRRLLAEAKDRRDALT